MKILVTGSAGFVGKNLCVQLENIRSGKAHCYGDLQIEEIMRYDLDTPEELLDEYCSRADFVFNLAGVNRPKDPEEFMRGNFGFASRLLETLERHGNRCPVMISSSTQAALDNPYGESKRAGEELMRKYGERTGAKVLIYRFPNLFGKWCRPNYNSAVATFCHNIAHDLPITVNDPSTRLNLVYIDDMVAEMIAALKGEENRNGEICEVPVVHTATLGEITDLLYQFHDQPQTLDMPDIPAGSLAKKLYSTYLSYLPAEKVSIPLKMNVDYRGSFTELLHTANAGQFSVNISNPGVTKGNHWHNTKWEFFIVVSGTALILQKSLISDEILEFRVSGSKIEAVHMLPGYTHNIINLSETEPLVTLMWANEKFDPSYPDTYFQPVEDNGKI
ncbi:MAG: capsular polysaccharide biosynthesis protein CapF [Clostridium sp.]|nr:capsular polysaccharide biosynthesis protein CapF [Prevotella sp.]MCM1429152.1 capsular polysaccharide biosynthesis protein CapF [Clostridium sp.]MCM1475320.1 capsular polysaccharide biosynthesis protein CapF [Muribaculaceae bacterium]